MWFRIHGVVFDAQIPENRMKILLASDTYYPHVNGASYLTRASVRRPA